MPKAWQNYVTLSAGTGGHEVVLGASLTISYNHNNPSGFKIQLLIRINNGILSNLEKSVTAMRLKISDSLLTTILPVLCTQTFLKTA